MRCPQTPLHRQGELKALAPWMQHQPRSAMPMCHTYLTLPSRMYISRCPHAALTCWAARLRPVARLPVLVVALITGVGAADCILLAFVADLCSLLARGRVEVSVHHEPRMTCSTCHRRLNAALLTS